MINYDKDGEMMRHLKRDAYRRNRRKKVWSDVLDVTILALVVTCIAVIIIELIF